VFHSSRDDQPNVKLPMSSAVGGDNLLSADQPKPLFATMCSAPREEEEATSTQNLPGLVIDLPASASAAASVGASAVGSDLPSQYHCARLFSVLDDSDDATDADVELIKFEPPSRCVPQLTDIQETSCK